MPRISEKTIEEILARADAIEIIGKYVHLVKKGKKYWGLSPFKKENTPSFTVDPISKLYYCFSTAQGGSVYTFIQKMENVNFVESVKILGKQVGIEVHNGKKNLKIESDTRSIHELLNRVTKTFEYFFWDVDIKESQIAQEYMKERGISEETLKVFKVGYAHTSTPYGKKWLYYFLQKKEYSKALLAKAGLFSTHHPMVSIFNNRIVFPITNLMGDVLGFGGRILFGKGPKYINSSQTVLFYKKRLLYGLETSNKSIKEQKEVYVVEGYIDVMTLYQIGIKATVAPLGTSFTDEQALMLRRMTDSIVIVFDNDQAGKNAAIKVAISCEKVGFHSIKTVVLSGKDPSDVLIKDGASALHKQLLSHKDWFEYYISCIFPSETASYEQKENALTNLMDYVSNVRSDYRKSLYIVRISELFKIDSSVLLKNDFKVKKTLYSSGFKKMLHKDTPQMLTDNKELQRKPFRRTFEILALSMVCAYPEKFESIRMKLKISDFADENSRIIYSVLENCYREGRMNINIILASLPEHICQNVTKIIATGEVGEKDELVIETLMYRTKLARLRRYSREIDMRIRQTMAIDGYSKKELDKLLKEKQFYAQKLSYLLRKNK